MASVQNFIKWIKERTRKQSKTSPKASIMRLGKLPPVPPRDEYGFTKNTDLHIYEEIHTMTSDEELDTSKFPDEITELPICSENISQTLQKLDFTHAKEIGPYLVVPIVSDGRDGNESCDSGAGDLADLILSSSVNDSRDSNSISNTNIEDSTKCSTPRDEVTYDYSKSLYNSIPPWARAKLKDAQCKRHGLALKETKKVADTTTSGQTRNEYSISDLSSISSCSDHVFNRGQRSEVTNRCCGGSDSSDSVKTFSEYDIGDYDDPTQDKNYEYFLVKAEKNFLLEKELKKYIDETSDSILSSSSSSQSDSMSLTTVTSMSDVSTIFSPELSRSDSDVRSSDETDTSVLSDQSCYCCRGLENSLFCAKASKSVNSVLLVQKRPTKNRVTWSTRNRSSSRDREKSRDSARSRKNVDSKSNGACEISKFSDRRRSFGDLLSLKSSARQHSVDELILDTTKCDYKFTRSNTMPIKELEKQVRRDIRKSLRDQNVSKDRHEKSRKHSKDSEKSRKQPKEYKLPGVSKEYVFSTDSEYKFCTLSQSAIVSNRTDDMKNGPRRKSVGNMCFGRDSERYSCRATEFLPRKPGRMIGGAAVPSEDTYGSIYGTLRGQASQTKCQNRLLGDMMRMNHDRQLFHPF